MSNQTKGEFWSRVGSGVFKAGYTAYDIAVSKGTGTMFNATQKISGQPTTSEVMGKAFNYGMGSYHTWRMNSNAKKGNMLKANLHAEKANKHMDKFNGIYQKNPTAKAGNKGIESMENKSTSSQSAMKSGQNKGIEAARLKATDKQSGKNTNQTINQGIKSYQSKANDQSANSSKGSSNGISKGSNINSGKSSGGQSSSSKGQGR